MTKLLDDAFEALRNLPVDAQDAIARVMLRLAGRDDKTAVWLSVSEHKAIAASKAAADHGEIASDDLVCTVWAKRGL